MPESQAGAPGVMAFRGGTAGALAPFALFLAGVAALALAGAPDERGFWPVLLAAMALGLFLARDRERWAETALAAMSQPIVTLMVLAWILAGVLAALLNASGLVEALVWAAQRAGVAGGGWAAAAFLVACLISTATGTSLGTVILCAPILYPPGAALGTDPVILMGAILGGATFGDNVSPVSDTTIASATTQGASIASVVRTRMRYALPAAAAAIVGYAALGGDDAASTATGVAQAADPRGLPMLAAPAFVLALLLARRHLLEGLLFGSVVTVALGLACGRLEPAQVLHIDAERFGARGLIVEGVERGVGVSIFTILLMGLLGPLEATGLLDRLVARLERGRATPRAVEARAVGITSAAVLLTTHSVVAMLAVAPYVRRAGEAVGLSAQRRANLLDMTVCTWPFLLPYCIPTILAASTTAAGEAAGLPRLSALEVGMANLHSWGLLAMTVIAVASGYGRERG